MTTSSGIDWRPHRRGLLRGAGAAALVLAGGRLLVEPVLATPDEMAAEIERLIGARTPKPGKVTLDLPAIAEDGSNVRLTVSVDSPMTPDDHVKAIHLLSEHNPLPRIASFHLTPRSGLARIETRIRLARTQTVTALAETADGTVWSGSAKITVTVGGCAA